MLLHTGLLKMARYVNGSTRSQSLAIAQHFVYTALINVCEQILSWGNVCVKRVTEFIGQQYEPVLK